MKVSSTDVADKSREGLLTGFIPVTSRTTIYGILVLAVYGVNAIVQSDSKTPGRPWIAHICVSIV